MGKNIIVGVTGAVVGGLILYFVLGLPSEIRNLDRRLATLEGKFDTFTVLRKEFEALQNRVDKVQDTLQKVSATARSTAIVAGKIGESDRWGSGWIDLDTATEFRKGEKLRLKVGGTASKILVRLLAEGQSPDSTSGVIQTAISVPQNRTVVVELQKNYSRIVQVSVHGGPNPWGTFPLGKENGPASLQSLELIRP